MKVVGPVGLAVALVLLLIGCGDDNGDASSDEGALCDGVEALAGLEDRFAADLDEGFDGLAEAEDGDPVAEVDRQEVLLTDLVTSYGDLEADVTEAFETMLAGAEDDELGRTLDWQLGYQRIVFEVLAGVETTDDFQAAWDDIGTLASQRLDGRPDPRAVRELGALCGVDLGTQPFGRRLLDSGRLREPEEEQRQLPDVDLCSLLPTDTAVVLQLEGVPGDGSQEGTCRWEDESASGYEVELFLVDPPFPSELIEGWEPYPADPDYNVFRRLADVPTECEALVDAEGYFVILSMEGPFEGATTACDLTPLVAADITSRLG